MFGFYVYAFLIWLFFSMKWGHRDIWGGGGVWVKILEFAGMLFIYLKVSSKKVRQVTWLFTSGNSIFGPFGGQNVGPGSVKNDKKGYFHTSHFTCNPVVPKKEVLKSHILLKH